MENPLNKCLVYISSLQNVIEINILSVETVEKFSHVPKVLLMLGVSDIFNVVHRISQKMVIDDVSEHSVKSKVIDIMNEIVNKVVEECYLNAYGSDCVLFSDNLSLNETDIDFLVKLRINPGL